MIRLEQIRRCFEGWVPSTLATCDAAGVPNITYVSQVHFVDARHVALTFQFFNKTRANILQNPQATLLMIDPLTVAQYRLSLVYKHTESEGALFQSMKAKLAGIASASGMEKVFHLRGADIYQVLHIEPVPCVSLPLSEPEPNRLLAVRQIYQQLEQAQNLDELFEQLLENLAQQLGLESVLLMLLDESGEKLYTLASRGYAESGAGSEIPLGVGVAGTAALYRTPIRIGYASAEYGYLKAMQSFAKGEQVQLETQIHYPGLAQPHSQLAMPLLHKGKLLGVIYAESETDQYFDHDQEDALALVASYTAQLMQELKPAELAIASEQPRAGLVLADGEGDLVQIRYFAENHSVFIDQDYLIKGVAGAILWRLLQIHMEEGRTQFSNRELRLDKCLKLPDLDDNLEARLILLRRRLAERCQFIRLERVGRGTFSLCLGRPLALVAA